jgi:hypothetical protein
MNQQENNLLWNGPVAELWADCHQSTNSGKIQMSATILPQ